MIFLTIKRQTKKEVYFYNKIFVQAKVCIKFALLLLELAHGVTGNTSVFGTEESRFEP